MNAQRARALVAFAVVLLFVVGLASGFPDWILIAFAALVVCSALVDLFSERPPEGPLRLLGRAIANVQSILRYPLTARAERAKAASEIDDLSQLADLTDQANELEQKLAKAADSGKGSADSQEHPEGAFASAWDALRAWVAGKAP